jgi:3-hydroxyisobutyrate dehydrogenase-like beta-hydroxyacid dehydrogenase
VSAPLNAGVGRQTPVAEQEETSMAEPLGFVGLGQMGSAMAGNLLAAGFPLRVFNRTQSKARALTDKGATLAASPTEVGVRGGIVLSILADGEALEAVATDEFAKSIGQGGVHVSMSTVLPETSRGLAARHARHGVAFVAAPVFGRPEAAATRKLWIATSGPATAKHRLKQVFDALGQGAFDFGEDPGAANVVKLAANFLVYSAVEAMAEASALAEKNGVPRGALLGMLTQTLFNSYAYTVLSRRIVNSDYGEAAFTVALGLKDMKLARETATASQTPMPILGLLYDRYISALAKGRADLDASALALGAAEESGLNWWPNTSPNAGASG